jgi:hypothetical protein
MPRNDDGSYRPFTNTEKTEVVNYLENLYRAGGQTDKDMVYKAGARFNFHNDDLLAGYTFLRQAKRAVDATGPLTHDPTRPPDPRDFPNVPGDPELVGMFIYDVLIIVTDPATGEKYFYRHEIASDIPLSLDAVKAMIEADRDKYLPKENTRPVPDSVKDRATLEIFILDIGRVT